MTEEELRHVEYEHPEVTVSDTRGRVYQGCPSCPQLPGLGLAPQPCAVRRLAEEVRRLGGWVELMERRLEQYDPDWSREMRP